MDSNEMEAILRLSRRGCSLVEIAHHRGLGVDVVREALAEAQRADRPDRFLEAVDSFNRGEIF